MGKMKIAVCAAVLVFVLNTDCCFTEEYSITAAENKAGESGDVNGDGAVDASDLKLLLRNLLGMECGSAYIPENADTSGNGITDITDLCIMKNRILFPEAKTRTVYVRETDELKAALLNAQAGDEIVLAEGEYVYSGSTEKGFMFKSDGEGTREKPIVIRSENPDRPAVLSGIQTNSNTVLRITGDWWRIENLKITGAQKGIVLDNSNYSKIIGCEVYNIGSEGIHLRDDSSFCTVDDCYVHDTGVVSPGYGEAVYIGSAKNTTGYGFDCNYNFIKGCRLGPNVAAEHIDVKEYTTGTVIQDCVFDGKGMSGENSSKSFVNIKGNDCILRNNTGYRNGCEKILRAFEQNQVVDGWGQNAFVYGNKVYMDTATGSTGKKMYFLNSWNCTVTAGNNFMAYESGELFSVDDEKDHWLYYNCDMLTYYSENTKE